MANRPVPVDVPAFAAAQLDLLAAELQLEVAETAAAVGGHTPAALQRAGQALTNLTVGSRRTGMGGRTVLTLEPDAATSSSTPSATGTGSKGEGGGPELPEHGLRTGDVVLVAEQPGGSAKKREMRDLERRGVRGVVTRVRRGALEVAVDDDSSSSRKQGSSGGGDKGDGEEESLDALLQAGRVWLVKLADEVTYRRMSMTMRKLQEMPEAGYTSLMRVLFGLSSPVVVDDEGGAIEWQDPTLNDSQKEAVRFALASKEVALIHGPPGTGKTHTLVELILQMVRRGLRVLVCGPSNISVDNLVERLAPHSVPMVRLGHPARLLPSVLNHALDVLTQTSAAGAIVRDVRADMDAKQAELRKPKSKGGPAGRSARRAIYADLRDLRREYRDRERRCVRDLVTESRVVLATLHGAGGSQLRFAAADDVAAAAFDVVVIDEASQALEAQCWVPLLTAKKAVLAGDHLQLPPTVKSRGSSKGVSSEKTTSTKGPSAKGSTKKRATKESSTQGAPASATDNTASSISTSPSSPSLEYTLFDRLLDLHGSDIKRMLTTQYRMHEQIMRFPSDTLYEGRLLAAEAVRARLLRDLTYGGNSSGTVAAATVADIDETREPLIFIDTQGGDFPETTEEDATAGADKTNNKTSTTRSKLFGDSKCNAMEALLVQQHVRTLVTDGRVRPQDIAVITPYNAQLGLLTPLKAKFPGIELGSVDGFQGREKEAVIVSLVRSNTAGDVGFLAEKRRLNVAMTRPKRSLTVIGDSETVKRGGTFLKSWMQFLEENADLRYPDVASLGGEAL